MATTTQLNFSTWAQFSPEDQILIGDQFLSVVADKFALICEPERRPASDDA